MVQTGRTGLSNVVVAEAEVVVLVLVADELPQLPLKGALDEAVVLDPGGAALHANHASPRQNVRSASKKSLQERRWHLL